MLEWAKASYSEGTTDDRMILTTLEYEGTYGGYNVFVMDNGTSLVIFADQRSLLKLVKDNLGSVFLIRLLLSSDSKYKYVCDMDNNEQRVVFTVSRAAVVVKGTEQENCKIFVRPDNQTIIIE